MSKTTATGRRDAFDRLALKIREVIQVEHVNSLSGAERFTVIQTTPLLIEHMGSDLKLEEGDPDFTVGAWFKQYRLTYALAVGDQVWCVREGQIWHLFDLADPGGQHAWTPAP